MRVPVKVAKGRRSPVCRSEPTYSVDLTESEIDQILWALKERITNNQHSDYHYNRSVSAQAVVRWARYGRS